MKPLLAWFFPGDAGLTPQAHELWQKYLLTLKPKFYLAMLLLGLMAGIRSVLTDVIVTPGVYFVTLVAALALILYRYKLQWFRQLDTLIALSILSALIWQHFNAWPLGLPAPALVLCSLLIVLFASVGHIQLSTLTFLISLALVALAVVTTPVMNQNFLLAGVALAVTPLIIYLLSLVLWLRELRLFNRRSAVLSAIRDSIGLRDGLLQDFWQRLTEPLDQLTALVSKPQVAWQEVCVLADKLNDELAQASRQTMELEGKLYYPANSLDNEIELLSRSIMKTLINCAAIVTGLIMVIYLLAGAPVRASLIGAVAFSLVLLASADAISANLNRRRTAIYGFFVFMVWGCVNQLMVSGPMYDLIYGFIFVFCAFTAATLVDAVVMTVGTFLLLAIWFFWYESTPPLPELAVRSNILLTLTFIVVVSSIRFHWFRRFLVEVGEQEKALQRERELRQRLMATLFHDLANPLHVIVGHAWFASQMQSSESDAVLLRKMCNKIHKLLEVTRLLSNSDDATSTLALENMAMSEVMQDLQETFGERMKAKQLKLVIEPSNARVRVHATVLTLSVLSNLLTNAIKFSPSHGTITIATTIGIGVHQGMLGIHITDQGEGIPAAVIDSIRRNLIVPSAVGTAGEAGHGQGLRLAAMYLEKMQGALEFGRGSTVTAYVQLAN